MPRPEEWLGEPTLGEVRDDHVWTGVHWQQLHGRDVRDAFEVMNGFFWPLEPLPHEVDYRDIARGISQECRFGGQTPYFYSVAWHSVAVSYVVPEHLQKWGLMHDAAEAYLSDIPRIIKKLPPFEFIKKAEADLLKVVALRFEMNPILEPPELKPYDVEMSHTEMLVMYGDLGEAKLRACGYDTEYLDRVRENSHLIQHLTPVQAETAWLRRFQELFPEWGAQLP